MVSERVLSVISRFREPKFRSELARRFGIDPDKVTGMTAMQAPHTQPATVQKSIIDDRGELLGIDNAGNPFFSKDVKANPRWWRQITNLTAFGKKVVAEIREAMFEINGGVIRDEADFIDMINRDRAAMGRPPVESMPKGAPSGEIRSEEDFQAEIKRMKWILGREEEE